LYGFDGEKTFNELSLLAGQVFEILKEDVQDGWSLALAEQHGTWTKGLVPQGWYTYVQEFTASPLHKPAHPDKQLDDQALSSITLGRSSHAEKAAKDHGSQEVGRNDQGLLDVADIPASQRIRPASGVGRMSSGLDESNGARQLLSQFSNTGTPIKGTKNMEIAANTLQVCINQAATTMSTPTSEMSFDVSSVPDVTAVATAETSASSITTTKSDASKSGWRPPGLLGGRSLNRYSPYVVSGAEQYILAGDEERTSSITFKIVHGAHDGPAWQPDGCELVIEVHSPETHLDERDRPFTAYAVHTSYVESKVDHHHRDLLFDPYVRPEQATYATNVYRRYNQFRWLAGHVQRYYPTLALAFAPLPDASHGAGRTVRMEPTFVERRRRHLQSWLTTVVRHPVLAADAGVLFFLQSEEEGEDWTWKARELQRKMRYRDASSSSTHLFARTLHPLFNVDVHELTVQAEQIQRFARVYERCMVETRSGVLDAIKDARQSALNNAECYRQMSLSLLGLITGASTTTTTASKVGQTEHTAGCAPLPPMGNLGMRDGSGATNEDRAWCWREGCAECRRMTLAMQLTAAALQHVAEGYATYAQTAMFDLHDRTYNASKVQRTTSALFDVQKNALSTYAAASESIESSTTSDEQRTAAERIAARCETVLNVVMGELDRVHDDRVQHWNALSRHMLDEQISFHAEALNGLQTARQRLDGIMHSQHSGRGPILPSPYEEQLIRPLAMPVLQMPSMTLVEPSTAAKAVHPVTFAGEMLSDWLGGGGRQI
jgi:sorting nexin-9/18/33